MVLFYLAAMTFTDIKDIITETKILMWNFVQ